MKFAGYRIVVPLGIFSAVVLASSLSSPSAKAQGVCSYIQGPNLPPVTMRTSRTGGSSDGSLDIYTIQAPDTRYPAIAISQIGLRGGDRVKVQACGCAQTGGAGQTWKHYVRPRGARSDRIYAGTIGFIYNGIVPQNYWSSPTGMDRLSVWMARYPNGFTIPSDVNDAAFILGYQDDDYRDNGYYDHDEGNDGQCRGLGNVEVTVNVYRKKP